MFRMQSFQPAELAGTIKVKKPIYGLGDVTDVDGKRWNVNAVLGTTVCACPCSEMHPYFSDTSTSSSYGLVSQVWKPYKVEVVNV